jgi:hypothetical protein
MDLVCVAQCSVSDHVVLTPWLDPSVPVQDILDVNERVGADWRTH